MWNKTSLAWFFCCGILSTAWCWTAAHAIGPTYDEPFYIQAGLKNWHDLNHRELLTQGTMPLPAEVQTLPLRVAEVFGSVDMEQDRLAWLPIARMANISFWWMLLWGSFRLGWIYGGSRGGCLATALVASEPILLGHASLAATDIAFTACLIALLAIFRARRDEPTWQRRLLLPAVFFTLTFLAKASAMLFTPMCLLMVELERLWSAGWRPWKSDQSPDEKCGWRPVLESGRDLLVIGALGIALLFIVCPRCLRGLLYIVRHQANCDAASFLCGEVRSAGFRYYFLAALAIKLALPVFVLIAVLLVLRPRYLLCGAFLAALGLLALTPGFRLQIGVRYVLPIAVLTLIAASAGFARLWMEQPAGWRRHLPGGLALALVLWSGISSFLVWPHGICYTNEIWGGTSQGYRVLNDSNYDWGQGLVELAAWQREHPEAPLDVCYFGTDPELTRLPIRSFPPAELITKERAQDASRGGFLAVSTNYCAIAPATHFLRTTTPYDRTMTFLIFDFRPSVDQAKR